MAACCYAFERYLLSMEIFEMIMGTFTLGTAIGLNINASFNAGSVHAAAWNKAKLFFLVVCVFAGNVLMLIQNNPSGKFPNRPWNLWKASTAHEQSKYWQYWSVFFE